MKPSYPNPEISLVARLAAAAGASYGQYVPDYEAANRRCRKPEPPKPPKPKRVYFRSEQRPDRDCAWCGEFIRNPRYNQSYCSRSCQRKARYRERKSAHPDGNPK